MHITKYISKFFGKFTHRQKRRVGANRDTDNDPDEFKQKIDGTNRPSNAGDTTTTYINHSTESASSILEKDLRVKVEDSPIATTEFFDVDIVKGKAILRLNSNHIYAKNLLYDVSPEKRIALEVCLAAWARMELECTSEKRLALLQVVRRDWGQLLDDYLDDDV